MSDYRLPAPHGAFGPTVGHLLKCNKCGRKILVEYVLYGSPHAFNMFVTCGECVDLSAEFRKEFLDATKTIEDWLKI